jgi:ABC-type Fe3+/spermidine/putrescine transport system ATPase subunit
MAISDLIVVMREGRIEQAGPPAELYARPKSRFIAEFFGAANAIAGEARRDPGGSWTFVAATGWRVAVAADPSRAEGPAEMMVRPERISWAEERPIEVIVEGQVSSRAFLGERHRYEVRLADGRLLVVSRPNLPGISVPEIGAPVRLGWNRGDAVLL